MNPQADVVKKGYLKFKTAKVKGSTASSTQGPKTFKDFWFTFRALEIGTKVLEYYANEKKFSENSGLPKGNINLGWASCVQRHDPEKKHQFSIEMTDGTLCFFEAVSMHDAEEWMLCLNAVLFGKGPHGEGCLQYYVDLQDSPRLPYAGPCILEVKNGELVAWTRDTHEQVVRWNLAHIRSFKAKKSMLTVFPGSRSSTGVGEFYFSSTQSVQITHAIETIVHNLKKNQNKSGQSLAPSPRPALTTSTSSPNISRIRGPSSDRRPLPALPLHPTHTPHSSSSSPSSTPSSQIQSPCELVDVPDHIPPEHLGGRKASVGAIANIPSYQPPEYEELDHIIEDGLNETPLPLPPHQQTLSPVEVQEEYGKLDHAAKPQVNGGQLHAEGYGRLGQSSPNSRRRLVGYESVPGGEYEDVPDGPSEGYGKLERHALARPISMPQSDPVDGYGQLDRKTSPTSRRKKAPPPKPAPYKRNPEPVVREEMYSEVTQDARVTLNVRPEEYNVLARDKCDKGSKSPIRDGYGVLNRRNSMSNPELLSSEHYGAFEHFPRSKTPIAPPSYQQDEYGKLEGSHFDPYGSLEHGNSVKHQLKSKQNGDYEELPSSEEYYGKLQRNGTQSPAEIDRPRPPPHNLLNQEDSLPDSEEFYSALKPAEDTVQLKPSTAGREDSYETLYEFPDTNPLPPPVPPRRGLSMKTAAPLPTENKTPLTEGKPYRPPKPKPKPTPR